MIIIILCSIMACALVYLARDSLRTIWRDEKGAISFDQQVRSDEPLNRCGRGTRMVFGDVTLAAGTASQAIPNPPANMVVICSRDTAGGVIGDLRAVYTSPNVVVTSANAGDTSIVNFLAVG